MHVLPLKNAMPPIGFNAGTSRMVSHHYQLSSIFRGVKHALLLYFLYDYSPLPIFLYIFLVPLIEETKQRETNRNEAKDSETKHTKFCHNLRVDYVLV